MKENLVLHAGPPTTWDRMCSTQKKGIKGAALFEGLARDLAEAGVMADRGELIIETRHEHRAVGSMTSITSPHMPVMGVENPLS